jgi:hypothetical protein
MEIKNLMSVFVCACEIEKERDRAKNIKVVGFENEKES